MGNREDNYPDILPQEQLPTHLSLPCNSRVKIDVYGEKGKVELKTIMFAGKIFNFSGYGPSTVFKSFSASIQVKKKIIKIGCRIHSLEQTMFWLFPFDYKYMSPTLRHRKSTFSQRRPCNVISMFRLSETADYKCINIHFFHMRNSSPTLVK